MIQRIDTLAWEEDAGSLADLAKQLLAERDEARELVRMARSIAPALCDADQWLVWDAIKKALQRWDWDKEEPGGEEEQG